MLLLSFTEVANITDLFASWQTGTHDIIVAAFNGTGAPTLNNQTWGEVLGRNWVGYHEGDAETITSASGYQILPQSPVSETSSNHWLIGACYANFSLASHGYFADSNNCFKFFSVEN